MSVPLLGAYRPGDGPLHGLRPGAKLLGLFAAAIVVMATRGVLATAVGLGIALVVAVLAGMRGRDLWRTVRGFLFIAVPLFAFQAWQHGPERGVEIVGGLLTLILLAASFTASTAVEDTMATVVWALRPLRRLGVDPERVALAFSLVLSTIPTVMGIARDTREAARARGLERSPRALVTPLVLRTVAHAHEAGDAMRARGVGDD